MRLRPLMFAALAAGCTRGSHPVPPAPAPLPAETAHPAPPPSPPPVAIDGHSELCVVRNGRLESVEIEVLPSSGDSLYQGRAVALAFPTDSTYALNAEWYRSYAPVPFAQGRYIKYGLPRVLATTDVVPFGSIGPVTVFAEPSANRRLPLVIYVPVRPGCEFQPYQAFGNK